MHNEHANDADVRVASHGELDAYSDEAVRQFFGAAAEPVAYRDSRR